MVPFQICNNFFQISRDNSTGHKNTRATSECFFTQMSFLPQKVELFGQLTLARADTSNIPQLRQIILNCF